MKSESGKEHFFRLETGLRLTVQILTYRIEYNFIGFFGGGGEVQRAATLGAQGDVVVGLKCLFKSTTAGNGMKDTRNPPVTRSLQVASLLPTRFLPSDLGFIQTHLTPIGCYNSV